MRKQLEILPVVGFQRSRGLAIDDRQQILETCLPQRPPGEACGAESPARVGEARAVGQRLPRDVIEHVHRRQQSAMRFAQARQQRLRLVLGHAPVRHRLCACQCHCPFSMCGFAVEDPYSQ